MLPWGSASSPGRAALVLLAAASFPGRGCPRPGPLAPLLVVPARGRKSRDDPPAKSKEGRINRPPPVDAAELLVVQKRYRSYRRIVRALRCEFRQEMVRQWEMKKLEQQQRKEEEKHHQLMEWNDAENRRLQALREERLRQEEIAERERLLKVAQVRAATLEEFMKEKEKEVLQLQEEAKNFITPENLDERIEECLNSLKNYNFAIDKEGRIVKRSTLS
ncbi:small ribosomal subunit protein mS26 [Pogona vitticeps]